MRATLLAALLMAPVSGAIAAVPAEHLEQYGKGIISDYSSLEHGEPIEWLWLAPDLQLSAHRFDLRSYDNLTLLVDDDLDGVLEAGLPRVLSRAGARGEDAPTLVVDVAVYWAERANRAKRWIPYAGAHVAQAGVGVELVLTDAEGNVVGLMRHSGREGDELKLAAQELVDEIAAFINAN